MTFSPDYHFPSVSVENQHPQFNLHHFTEADLPLLSFLPMSFVPSHNAVLSLREHQTGSTACREGGKWGTVSVVMRHMELFLCEEVCVLHLCKEYSSSLDFLPKPLGAPTGTTQLHSATNTASGLTDTIWLFIFISYSLLPLNFIILISILY